MSDRSEIDPAASSAGATADWIESLLGTFPGKTYELAESDSDRHRAGSEGAAAQRLEEAASALIDQILGDGQDADPSAPPPN